LIRRSESPKDLGLAGLERFGECSVNRFYDVPRRRQEIDVEPVTFFLDPPTDRSLTSNRPSKGFGNNVASPATDCVNPACIFAFAKTKGLAVSIEGCHNSSLVQVFSNWTDRRRTFVARFALSKFISSSVSPLFTYVSALDLTYVPQRLLDTIPIVASLL
jgi:hypothetical protein